MAIPVLISFAFFAAVIVFTIKGRGSGANLKNAAIIVLALALVFRLITGYFTVGYQTDINTFKAWAELVHRVGYAEIYNQGVFLDYPPGYLYILDFLESLRRLFMIDQYSNLFTLMIKLPSILADIGCGCLIFLLGRRRIGDFESLFLSAAYLFCPAILINSTIWGQADSFTMLLLLVSLLFLYRDKPVVSAVIYGVGVLCKPQMLIFAPIFIFYTLFKKNIKGFILGILASLLTIMVIATPFIKDFNYLWLIDKYRETMDYYGYYTINAYNLWALIGKNWAPLPEEGAGLLILNWFGPFLATVLCGLLIWKSKKKSAIFIAPAVLMATVYIFSVKMHERYLFPVLLFLIAGYLFSRDKRFIWLFAGFSLIHYLNVKYVLVLNNTYIDAFAPEILILSAAHMAMYLYMLWVIYSSFIKNKIHHTPERAVNTPLKDKPASPLFPAENIDRRIKAADIIVVCAITLVYGTAAFWNLGAGVSANTSWIPGQGESVVLETQGGISSMTYMPGIAANADVNSRNYRVGLNISVEVSDDMVNWTGAGDFPESYVYEWKEGQLTASGRYVRITSTGGSTTLNEVGFKNPEGTGFLPVKLVSGDGETLIDEQNALPLHPSSYNSTYFDEIYHARTAYEHIIGVEPYESTHPPLGKLIISCGIMIFGMNPFGWRFMGVLFGILMLPVFYHLLKRLFGSTFLCGAATILFAFDFMHFTQTRIATIDTYAVFFMLLMVDAMIVFIQKDIMKSGIRQLILPLAVSGVFMGIGVASKWTVAYAAIGLAALFFGKLFVTYRAQNQTDKIKFKRLALKLCLWCILLFIFIPFALYFCAFLPMTTLPQNISRVWSSFTGYQTGMFNYHSTLVATHPFSSPWYEWPLDIKSIWYFGNQNVDGMGSASTIVCLGNPILWWSGLIALIGNFAVLAKERTQTSAVIAIGFLAAYLPWVLVPRLTFIYHYFTAVPFIIMALAYIFLKLGRNSRPIFGSGVLSAVTGWHILVSGFVLLNIILFIVFYPVISGAASSYDYLKGLEWLPGWHFI